MRTYANSKADVFSRASSALYYRMMAEDGSLQFRYWVATQRHEYDHMLSFFNIIEKSKNVKRANSIACDRIKTKQILFLPMLAKKLSLEEAS